MTEKIFLVTVHRHLGKYVRAFEEFKDAYKFCTEEREQTKIVIDEFKRGWYQLSIEIEEIAYERKEK